MNYCTFYDQFHQNFLNLQESFERMDSIFRETNSENELLWDVICEYGNKDLLKKIFGQMVKLYHKQSISAVLNRTLLLLESSKLTLVIVGFRHLLHNPYQDQLTNDSLQLLFHEVLNRALYEAIPEDEEADQLYDEVFEFINDAALSKFRETVHEYLHSNHQKLSQLVIDTNSPNTILGYIRCLLSYDLYTGLRAVFDILLEKEWPFLDSNLEEEQFARFLWYAHYLDKDDWMLDVSKESIRFLTVSVVPEISLYQKYYELKNAKSLSETSINDFLALSNAGTLFNATEKEKLLEEVNRFLLSTRETAVVSEVRNESPLAMEIWQVKNATKQCPTCKVGELGKDIFIVEGKTKSGEVAKRVQAELMFCNDCNRIYTYDNMKQKLYRRLDPYKINIQLDPIDYPVNRTNKMTSVPSISNASLAITPSHISQTTVEYFKWPSTEVRESQGHSDSQSNFREETELHRLGYKITGLNRSKRWDILVRKAIPSLPLKEIVCTIARNVRLKKSQSGGKTKYAYAISELEHDLKRLKEEYYKYNFTWPQY